MNGRVELLRHAITFVDSFVDTCSCVDRDVQFLTQSAYSFDMVCVVVCNKYRAYCFHTDAHLLQ